MVVDLNRAVEGGSSFKCQYETNAIIYNTRQEQQEAIYYVRVLLRTFITYVHVRVTTGGQLSNPSS